MSILLGRLSVLVQRRLWKTRGLVGSSKPESFPRVILVGSTITLDNKLRGFVSRREDINERCGEFGAMGR